MNYCIVVFAALTAVAAAQHYKGGWGNQGFGVGGRGGFGGQFPGAGRGGFNGGWGAGGFGPPDFPGMSAPPSELPDIQPTEFPNGGGNNGPVVGWTQNPDITEGLFGFGFGNPGFGPNLPGVGGRKPVIPGRGPNGGRPGVGGSPGVGGRFPTVGRNPGFGGNPGVGGHNPGVGGRRPGTGCNFFTAQPPTNRPRGRTVPARRPTITGGYNPGVYGRGRGPFLMKAAGAANPADESYSSGQKAGIVLGVMFIIGIVGVIGAVLFKKHRTSSYSSHTDSV